MQSSSVREVQIPVSDLKIGMYVSRLDKAWVDSPFLFQGFLVETEKLLSQLRQECDYVYVDENKYDEDVAKSAYIKQEKSGFSLKTLFGSSGGTTTLAQPEVKRGKTHALKDIIDLKVATETIVAPKKVLAYDQEMGFAKQTHAKISDLMSEFSSQVKEGGTVDILIARQPVYDCMESILRCPDAMQLVMRLKSKHQSTWQQSMNDAVLAISFGRYLNLKDEDLITLGLCGLLHDIGFLRISKQDLQESANKKELRHSHTTLGRDILLSSPGQLGETVADVAYSHHEHLDGSGYPQGLIGEQISPYARMISIVSVYNTLTNNDGKSEKENMTHYEAISLMLKKADSHFDETLLHAFNQCIGTYPVGCVVEMNSGEVGMVVEVNEEHKLKPKVMLLTAEDKTPRDKDKKVVNLAENKTTSDGQVYFIKGIVKPEKYGIKL